MMVITQVEIEKAGQSVTGKIHERPAYLAEKSF